MDKSKVARFYGPRCIYQLTTNTVALVVQCCVHPSVTCRLSVCNPRIVLICD